jgi:glucosylceramidase
MKQGKLLTSVFIFTAFVICTRSYAQVSATVYTTAAKTELKIKETARPSFIKAVQPLEKEPCIFVDATHTFQEFIGIGGAITDATAETFAKLPPAKQKEFLDAYYNAQTGIGYTLARTNINSCDFSSDYYTYVKDNDSSLQTFNVVHDEKYKIPLIKQAMTTAGKLDLYVSPWSPPAWMKDNNSVVKGGKLKAAYRQPWANYYVKFIKTYEKMGIPVWGLSVQNEPMAVQRWESCVFTAEDERDFIKEYLGPTLKREGLGDKKLIAWDHNRDLMVQRALTLFNDPAASQYIWGMGFHWYETWTGGNMQFNNLQKVHELFPDKKLIFTEGCQEKFDWKRLDDWALGEKYAYSMINDFNAGTVAWTDWNILLDETGGPNHASNFCFAPVHADTKTGQLVYTNAYYYIGHFSKFIKPGAKRITSSSNRDGLLTTAFINTDNSIAVVVMNASDKEIPYSIYVKGMSAPVKSPPHSINTIVIR